jgi:hypothetical protein
LPDIHDSRLRNWNASFLKYVESHCLTGEQVSPSDVRWRMVAECELHEMVVTRPVRRELRLLPSSRRADSSFCRCGCEVRVVVVIRLANGVPQESVERFFADDEIPRSVFPAPGERDQAMIVTPVLQARWQFE